MDKKDNYFFEQYEIQFEDGTRIVVSVKLMPWDKEKNSHAEAEKIAEKDFPNKTIKCVTYC